MSQTIDECLHEGLAYHREDRFGEAGACYQRVLDVDPGNPNALHMMGLVDRHLGHPLRALERLGQALKEAPSIPGLATNLEITCRALLRDADARLEAGDFALLGTVTEALIRLEAAVPSGNPDYKWMKSILDLANGLRIAAQDRAALVDRDYIASIVIPSYNLQDYIRETLDSVKRAIAYYHRRTGSQQHFDIVVVDDGSSDDSLNVLMQWRASNPDTEVRVIVNAWNVGAATTRNVGVENAKGKYIFFIDADDYYFERHIYNCLKGFERVPEAAYMRSRAVIGASINNTWKTRIEMTLPGTLCIRKDCYQFVGGFPGERLFRFFGGDDAVLGLALQQFFIGGLIMDETLYYRKRNGNALEGQMERFSGDAKTDNMMDWHNDANIAPALARDFLAAALFRRMKSTPFLHPEVRYFPDGSNKQVIYLQPPA